MASSPSLRKHPFHKRFLISGCLAAALILSLAPAGAAYPRPGVTQRASVDPHGLEAPTGAGPSSTISANGRFVAFSSGDPIFGGGVLISQIQVRDLKDGSTEMASVSSRGIPGLGSSTNPTISDNGRYVAFQSDAPNLVDGDTNLASDIFVHDMNEGSTVIVSITSKGGSTGGNGNRGSGIGAEGASISGDGSTVSFQSTADDIVSDDDNEASDVFVHDLKSGSTERVSLTQDGAEAPFGGTAPSLSTNGRFLAFTSQSPLIPEDLEANSFDVYVRDLRATELERVSVDNHGASTRGVWGNSNGVGGRAISGDGRYVVFQDGDGLVPNDGTPTLLDVYVSDRKTGRTEKVSVDSYGAPADGRSESWVGISRDGRFVTFESFANNLVGDDTGLCLCPTYALGDTGDPDIFVHDMVTGSTEMVSRNSSGEEATTCGVSPPVDLPENPTVQAVSFVGASHPSISDHGQKISFESCSPNLVNGDRNLSSDIFVRDRSIPLGAQPGVDLPGDHGSGVLRISDASHDASAGREAAEILGATLAYRPIEEDLFVRIDVDRLTTSAGLLHVMELAAEGGRYQIRAVGVDATGPMAGIFGLFRCEKNCEPVARLRGGYGTTGEQVVVSVPLTDIGLSNGGRVTEATVSSGLGTYATGLSAVWDRAG